MNNLSSTYQIAIVGGGPVGLFLAACLHKFRISCIVLEKRPEPRPGSRSIGIHPVSLELFEQLGITDRFIHQGIKISRGHAFANARKIGSLSFDNCPPPFNFILSLPQVETESILESYVEQLGNVKLLRNAEVTDFTQQDDQITLSFEQDGGIKTIITSFLVGCDGKDSTIREKAGISFQGKTYPDTYIMGDFCDNSDFGNDALIFLCDDGLIESFPLPESKRRWVVKTNNHSSTVTREMIEQRVYQRINHTLKNTKNTMLSSFGVQKLIAKQMVKNRVVLAGDAAHVVSPIGGQGMNLGWLGARDLAQSLNRIINQQEPRGEMLQQFEKRRIKSAANSMRRAELNMRLGRKSAFPFVRNGIVSIMLNTPLSNLMAQVFTMRGVERWPF
jgi:2-polyprenyl-6-methoxyphenol hydroxylase-like FAD-dependent oxidoreductase